MSVDFEVSIDLDVQINQRVLREKSKHVIEEAVACCNRALARPVEIEREADFRFRSLAVDRRLTHLFGEFGVFLNGLVDGRIKSVNKQIEILLIDASGIHLIKDVF